MLIKDHPIRKCLLELIEIEGDLERQVALQTMMDVFGYKEPYVKHVINSLIKIDCLSYNKELKTIGAGSWR